MSAHRAAIPKKRKAIRLYDGSDGLSYSRPSGISGIRIATPFVHPFDMFTSSEAGPSGRQKKRARFIDITHAQIPAFQERAKQELAARKAGEHNVTCVST